MCNVIFYSEAPVFGGNEMMALRAHLAIGNFDRRVRITWIMNSANRRLASALQSAGVPHHALALDPGFRFLRNPFTFVRKTLQIARIFRRSRPNLIVLLQGWIKDGFDGVFAAHLAGIPFCSYIPMTHFPAEQDDLRWPKARVAVLAPFFRAIPRYITIDKQQAARLRRWHPRARIAVVENFVPNPPTTVKPPMAGARLGPASRSPVLGVVGRISFRQKAQDWLLQALEALPTLEDKTLLFFGEGPDRARLAQLIASSRWRDRIQLRDWCDNLDDIYGALDLLIIPSRLEGVPLVMIEALARRIPVVGSDRDGMMSWLPPDWRFPFGDAAAMQRSIECALGAGNARHWVEIDRHLASATDEQRFARDFAQALIDFCLTA